MSQRPGGRDRPDARAESHDGDGFDDDGFDDDGFDDDGFDDDPPRRSVRQRVLLTLGACASIVLLLGVGVVGYTYWRLDQIPRYNVDTSEALDDEPLNYLVVGSDSRAVVEEDDPNAAGFLDGTTNGSGQRADVIMVMRVYPEGDRLEILSIQRDLWVPIAGRDETSRINSAYGGEEGAQQLIDTIEANLDIPIHHYAEIDFRGFQDLVDQVDGVPMYFDTPFRDKNSGLWIGQAGCTTLDPEMALALVRSRHLEYLDAKGRWLSDPTGDHGRIARQQIFMRYALARARGRASLTNPKEYNDLIGVAIDHVHLDQDVEVTKLAAVGQRFAEFEGDTIETFALPVEDFTTNGGAQVVRLKEAEAQRVLNVFRGEDPDAISPAMADLTILNGSGVQGQAALAQEAYEAIDFSVTRVGDVPGGPIAETEVRYAPGNEVLASLVERHLTNGGILIEDETLTGFEVVVQTGTDFTTVEQEARPQTTTTAPADDEGDDPGAEAAPAEATTTTVIGRTPGEVPDGVDCG